MKKYFLSVIILMFALCGLSAKHNEPIIVATYNLRFNNPNDGMNACMAISKRTPKRAYSLSWI
jgi:hypothetical protein